MDHRIWLDQLIDGDSYRNAAAKIGINQSTITKQLGKEKLSAENVTALARAYGRRAGDELVVTGYLTDEDIEGVGVERALHSATNHQLLNEIDRRMADGIGDVFNEPVGTVHDLPTNPDGTLDTTRMKGAASRRVKETYPETPDDGL